MNTLNVKSGDTVVVITGKDKGKKGKVLETNPTSGRILVEGTKSFKKHKKPRSAQEQGGIININGTMDVSNVMILCSKCGKPTRVGHTIGANGKKVRICKHKDCGASLDRAKAKEDKKTKKSDKAEEAVKETAVKEKSASVKPADKEVKPAAKTATAAKKTTKKETDKE